MAWARTVGGDAAAFARAVRGATLARVWRRGKFLVLDLERARRARGLAGRPPAHDRAPGGRAGRAGGPPRPHVRLELDLDDGRRLVFIDPRKFGRLAAHDRARGGPAGARPGAARRANSRPTGSRRPCAARRPAAQAAACSTRPSWRASATSTSTRRCTARACTRCARAAGLRAAGGGAPARRDPRDACGGHRARGLELRRLLPHARGPARELPGPVPRLRPRPDGRARRCGTPIARLVVGQRGTHVCPRCQPRPRAERTAPERPQSIRS